MPEVVRHLEPPVPVVLRVRRGVDLHQDGGRLDVALLVEDAQVERQIRPVGRQRVEHGLEVLRQSHAGEPTERLVESKP